jgi:hypothetical protein
MRARRTRRAGCPANASISHVICFSSHLGPRYDPEYGESDRYPSELGERGIRVQRQMRSGPGRALHVRLEHDRPALGRDFLQAHLLATTVA